MRCRRLILKDRAFYHIISRTVDQDFKFTEVERGIFEGMMYRCADFAGIYMLDFVIMSNHFHLIIEVPKYIHISDAELTRRMLILYGAKKAQQIFDRWEQWEKAGTPELVAKAKAKMRKRMYNLSDFVKTLKQRFSISYNQRHGRKGTLWESRYISVILADLLALRFTSAYIALNPVRAKIVSDPKDYRNCGYAQAVAGLRRAREGLARLYGHSPSAVKTQWAEISTLHRQLIYEAGAARYDESGRLIKPGFSQEEIQKVLDAGGKLTIAQVLRCRVGYTRRSLILGTAPAIERVFREHRDFFSPKRTSGARPMKFAHWDGLCSFRDLKKEVLTLPHIPT